MTTETKKQLEADLAAVEAALSRVLEGGEEYKITSGSTSREVRRAKLAELIKERNNLRRQLGLIGGPVGAAAGW